ncbi:MAG TPA: hypothetical protein VFE03_05410 [Caulobacteraceae bacterium]|nr:hypothetical protein [Caulobacteraceae bacterium]
MHKETPFGWVLLVQALSSTLADAHREHKAALSRQRDAARTAMSLPGDLHHLAAPH